MVEVSPHLRGMQWRALRCQGSPPLEADPGGGGSCDGGSSSDGGSSGSSGGGEDSSSRGPGSSSGDDPGPDTNSSSSSGSGGVSGVSGWSGVPVSWHRSLEEVAAEGGPSLYIAHEFLDALPVHQFQKTGGCGWHAGCGSGGSGGRRGDAGRGSRYT